MARNYTASLPGGTATTTVQMQSSQTLKQCLISIVNAAAGTIELSTSSASQIGTAQPTNEVLFRVRSGATASHTNILIPLTQKVTAFQSLYFHQTGAGNVGDATLM